MMTNHEQLNKYAHLRQAIKNKDRETAKQLILNHAIVNLNRKVSNTPLHWAVIKFQDTELIELLLNKNADVYAENYRRQIPLDVAVQLNRVSAVQLFLKNRVYMKQDVEELIYDATIKGYRMIVKLLIDYGKINYPSMNLKHSLEPAVKKGYLEILEYIIPYCKYRKSSNKYIPSEAVLEDGIEYRECIDLLLGYGFTISHQNSKNVDFVYTAVRKRYVGIIEELIKLGIDVNMREKKAGFTLLHAACFFETPEIVEMLLKHKTNPNIKVVKGVLSKNDKISIENLLNYIGKSPLYIAVDVSNDKITNLLLEHGANLNKDPHFFDIVSRTMQKKDTKIFQILLDHGADVNAINDKKETFLHLCATYQHFHTSNTYDIQVKITELLLKKGANINSPSLSGRTPLFDAVRNECIKMTGVLLDHGADIHHRAEHGNTILIIASGSISDLEFMETLIDNNASVNAGNKNNSTPLHVACVRGHEKMVQLFLDRMAEIGVRDIDGRTPLHAASEWKKFRTIRVLLGNKADVNTQDKNGKTPLHLITQKGFQKWIVDIVKFVLQYNVNIDAVDAKGWTPLFNACEAGNIPVIKLLLDNHANINHTDVNGITPLCVAAENCKNDLGVVNLLLEYKANVHFVNCEGKTLIHLIAEKNCFDLVEKLIGMNININAVDNNKRTALHFAAEKEHIEMVKCLIKYGADISILDKDRLAALSCVLNCITDCYQKKIDNAREYPGMYEMLGQENIVVMVIESCRRETYIYRQIVKILKNHYVKLRCAGLSDELKYNFEENDDFFEDDEDDDEFDSYDFENDCEVEVERLKMENIKGSIITLHDILTRSIHDLAKCVKNKQIKRSLDLDTYNEKSPLYIDIMRNRLAKAVLRSKVLNIAERISLASVFCGLPRNCIDEVFSYLNIKELKKFIKGIN